MHGDANPGEVDRQEGSAGFPGQHTAGFERFPAPAIKGKDAGGLGDGVPALQIGQFAAIGLAGPNIIKGNSDAAPGANMAGNRVGRY
jgi:hypothetical protein